MEKLSEPKIGDFVRRQEVWVGGEWRHYASLAGVDPLAPLQVTAISANGSSVRLTISKGAWWAISRFDLLPLNPYEKLESFL